MNSKFESNSKRKRELYNIEIRRGINQSIFKEKRKALIRNEPFNRDYEQVNEKDYVFDNEDFDYFCQWNCHLQKAQLDGNSEKVIEAMQKIYNRLESSNLVDFMPVQDFFRSKILDTLINVLNDENNKNNRDIMFEFSR